MCELRVIRSKQPAKSGKSATWRLHADVNSFPDSPSNFEAMLRSWSHAAELFVNQASDVLIDQDLVSVRVKYDEARRTFRGLVCLFRDRHTHRLQLALELAHVGECTQLPGVAIPTRIEGQNVLFEHTLKESDDGVAIP